MKFKAIRKGDDGFYLLHYVVKQADMGKETRDKWIKNLESSSIRK